jgi:hypothetical protein
LYMRPRRRIDIARWRSVLPRAVAANASRRPWPPATHANGRR